MRKVSKVEFKRIYFAHLSAGWTEEYWQSFFEIERNHERGGWEYFVQEPTFSQENRMQIVTDFGAQQYRLFFMTEDGDESMYGMFHD